MSGFNKLYLIPLAVVILVVGAYYSLSRNTPSPTEDGWRVFDEPVNEYEEPELQKITIYITGEVVVPGVYELAADSRVADALEAAGGPTDEAALDRINLSARISDEAHVIIPKIGEELSDIQVGAVSGTSSSGKININTATSQELQTLSGVGPVTADRIIAYREANGGFNSIEEIKSVERIGDRTFEAMADYITVN